MYLKLAEQHFAVRMNVVLLKPKVATCAAEQVRRDFIQLDKFYIFLQQISQVGSFCPSKKKTLSLMFLPNSPKRLYLDTGRMTLIPPSFQCKLEAAPKLLQHWWKWECSQAAAKVGGFSCHSQMYTSVTEVSYQKKHNRTRVYENESSHQMSKSLLIT